MRLESITDRFGRSTSVFVTEPGDMERCCYCKAVRAAHKDVGGARSTFDGVVICSGFTTRQDVKRLSGESLYDTLRGLA